MANWRRKKERKQELANIRAEAREAARLHKGLRSCPHKYDMNEIQWKREYQAEILSRQKAKEGQK